MKTSTCRRTRLAAELSRRGLLFAPWLVIVAFVAGTPTVLADSWLFEPTVATEAHVFADVKIVAARDATEDQQYPEWAVTVYVADELRAFYGGLGFEHMAASRDNTVFVGISNSGLPGTAVVVFDRRGALLLERKHGPGAFAYCEQSETLLRRWYDEAEPDVRFEYAEGGVIRGFRVRGCGGDPVHIVLEP